METLYEETYFYAVERDEKTNEYFLEVLCGTVAVYQFRVKLTKREIESFLGDKTALQNLANQIVYSPGRFRRRKV